MSHTRENRRLSLVSGRIELLFEGPGDRTAKNGPGVWPNLSERFDVISVTCVQCGAQFEYAYRGTGDHRRLCSKECAKASTAAGRRRRSRQAWNAARVIIPDLPNEEWRPVVGYEGLYEVSNLGRVRSVERLAPVNHRPIRARILKTRVDDHGYISVSLCRNGRTFKPAVHRMVLKAFVGPCPDGHECCHGDGKPGNNRLDNLRWGTASENQLDSSRHGTHHSARKTHCKHGHEFTPENTYLVPGKPNWRNCRECHRRRASAAFGKRSA